MKINKKKRIHYNKHIKTRYMKIERVKLRIQMTFLRWQ